MRKNKRWTFLRYINLLIYFVFGSNRHDDSIEWMVHRRILRIDSLDIDEPINETTYDIDLVIHGKHFLIVKLSESSCSTYFHEFSYYKVGNNIIQEGYRYNFQPEGLINFIPNESP